MPKERVRITLSNCGARIFSPPFKMQAKDLRPILRCKYYFVHIPQYDTKKKEHYYDKAMKKLPIGVQTFSEIREEGHCYVDKTPLIYQMTTTGKYYFLSRPRRFGKSLLVSTLQAAFSGQKDLFNGLFLENNWDWQTVYPVLNLSLGSGIHENRSILDGVLASTIAEIAQVYCIELVESSTSLRFKELIRKLHAKYAQRVVILIDEYDKPILDNIDRPEIAAEMREGLKNFYSVIKDSDAHVKFALLTGVSKFSKVSLFSGLNNLKDITLDPRYATLCGYTESDIHDVFSDYLQGIDFDQLRQWYNGYNFLGEKVYNPYDVLLFLDLRLYRNYWFETGSPGFLIKLIQERHYAISNLESVLASDELLGSFDIEHIQLETLLFQTGYLTIDKVESLGSSVFYTLKYPNIEVKSSLTNSLLTHLTQTPAANVRNQKIIYHALQQGDMPTIKEQFHAFFASIPHDWYRKNLLSGYEGYYASIVYCYFAALGLDVTAEDTTNKGRIDLTVKLDNRIFLIEFKVISHDKKPSNALRQIKEKHYQEKFQNQGFKLYLVGVTFNKNTRNIVDFSWETT